jgi:aryl-alcohol dehydrogenase-like predicted oxidoreductase
MSAVLNLLEAALELGVTVFDTADIYGQGDSERAIGRLLKRQRDRGFVVTKLGQVFSAKMRLLAPMKPVLKPLIMAIGQGQAVTGVREVSRREDFSPARYPAALDASLRRLQFDHVDGLLLHGPSAQQIADPAQGEALARLKKAGKVRHFGVSCDDVATLRAALDMPGLTMLELPVDVIEQAEAGALGELVLSRGIIVLAREIMRLRPELTPVEAVRKSVLDPLTTCTIVGTSNRGHLLELAEAAYRR